MKKLLLILISTMFLFGSSVKADEGMWLLPLIQKLNIEKMQQIDTQLSKMGLSTLYLLCSDEPINIGNFQGLPIKTGNNHLIEDLYSLAACDYIMGPPSTYSMWASFYGQTPRVEIIDGNQSLSLDDFQITEG